MSQVLILFPTLHKSFYRDNIFLYFTNQKSGKLKHKVTQLADR